MREHIELRVLRSIVAKTDLNIEVSDEYHLQFAKIESELMAAPTTECFSRRYLALSLLKKWKGWDTTIDLHQATLDNWLAAEQKCYATNRRLSALDSPITDSPIDLLIRQVRREVRRILGDTPPEWWRDCCDWPTGATFDTKMNTLVHEKVCKKVTVSASAAKHMYGIYEFGYNLVKVNRVEFVPKTYKVHRPIACEPTANAFLQKGVGRCMRRLLRKNGVDLDNQASLNRELCYLAYSCELSTIDLEAASDTLSLSFAKLVLPHEWYTLLTELRSSFSEYKLSDSTKRVRLLDKLSSMGNGFTFELETILFLSICRACYALHGIEDQSTLGVFGDDIVCHRSVFELVTSALTFFGFVINPQKTYKDGAFFESCGKHYHCEVDVTPCYQKEVVGTSLSRLFIFHNKLFRWAQRTGDNEAVREALRLVRREIKQLLPRTIPLPFMPSFLDGDEALLTNRDIGFKYDKHGDVILDYALVKRRISSSLIEQSFYLKNWLRCGNSFYSDSSGHLQNDAGEYVIFKRKLKRWRSGQSTFWA